MRNVVPLIVPRPELVIIFLELPVKRYQSSVEPSAPRSSCHSLQDVLGQRGRRPILRYWHASDVAHGPFEDDSGLARSPSRIRAGEEEGGLELVPPIANSLDEAAICGARWRTGDAITGQLVEAVILDIDFAPFLAAGDEPRVAQRCILMNSVAHGPPVRGVRHGQGARLVRAAFPSERSRGIFSLRLLRSGTT